mmetsp:Transcript_54920/g.117859  ORF Transcript_54920/g.117859 Transcript_54920/m.117859 type:complete len:176 (+) Transcript_54920:57-584(+)|eukprot:CAMPEP_0180683264 /NCGR_PEP_ID=MMETSP1037_2-20121125/71041_1 /TAXON_ID=632150 /ORGANISM="Azadinium spinosum, Strain 3D9" /LENGTH=175 /DNA_ID=CAMNT_0022713399 /DNA_START=55 /DNA_END=582 /DNA_ORIENTATION=+
MASPLLIHLARNRSQLPSLGPKAAYQEPPPVLRESATQVLGERIRSAVTSTQNAPAAVQEGILLKRVGGLKRLLGSDEWHEHYFRLGGETAVLEYWEGSCISPEGEPPKRTFALRDLLAVAQPRGGKRELHLVLAGHALQRQILIEVRVPSGGDFHAWLAALARHAAATGDIEPS